jgi:hypothetical protein
MPTRSLPVALTDPDRLTIQKELSETITALKDAKEDKRVVVSSHNAVIKENESRMNALNESLVKGTVDREVEVIEKPDFDRGVVLIVRQDTGETCAERALDPDERQLMLGKKDDRVEN